MKYVDLKCAECGKEYQRAADSYYRKCIESGKKHFFCSVSCSTIFYNKYPSDKSLIVLTCEECGFCFKKEKKEYTRQLKKGRNQFYCSISCGAAHSNKEAPRSNIGNLKPPTEPWNLNKGNPFKWFVRRTKNRANNKESNVSVEYLQQLWNEQCGICPLTGFNLKLPTGTTGWIKTNPLTIYSASLDRIDNSKGYIEGNVRFISVMANYARNIFTDEEVIQFAEAVVEYNKLRKAA